MGFALQLCALRYPGRLLGSGEIIPESVITFIGAQLGMTGDALLTYAARRQTRQEHLVALREIYGYRMFAGRRARRMKSWLDERAEAAQSNEETRTMLRGRVPPPADHLCPEPSVIERLCADALVAAERRIEARIAARLDGRMHARLDSLLSAQHGWAHKLVRLAAAVRGQGTTRPTPTACLTGLNSCGRSICQPPRSAVFRPTGSRVCAARESGILGWPSRHLKRSPSGHPSRLCRGMACRHRRCSGGDP